MKIIIAASLALALATATATASRFWSKSKSSSKSSSLSGSSASSDAEDQQGFRCCVAEVQPGSCTLELYNKHQHHLYLTTVPNDEDAAFMESPLNGIATDEQLDAFSTHTCCGDKVVRRKDKCKTDKRTMKKVAVFKVLKGHS